MRVKHVQCKYRYQAYKLAPWASRLAKLTDGYMAFESITDYEIWRNQK